MTAEFRSVQTRMWREDEWFQELDTDARLLFIYLFTNPSASISGIYRLPLRTMAFESGLDIDRVRRLLDMFAKAGKVIFSDGIVWVVRMRENQLPGKVSPQVQARLDKDIASIPDCEVKRNYMIKYGYPIDTLSIHADLCADTLSMLRATDTDTDTELDTDTETELDTELLAPNGVVPMAQTSIVSALTPSNGNGKHEKPKRERSDKQKELDDWVNALAVALEFDAKIPGAYAKWTKIGKGYAAAGYVPADVLAWKESAWPLSWQYERGYKPSKNVLDDGLPEIRRKREKLEAKSRPTPPKALGVVNIDGKRMQILKHADGREELKEIVEVTA